MATPHGSAALVSLQALYLHEATLARAMLAPLTRQGYGYDFSAFCRFCTEHGLTPLPASCETISLFVCHKLSQGRKASSVRRLVAGIVYHHREQGHTIEWLGRVEQLLVGARRLNPQVLKQSAPLKVEDLRAISRHFAKVGTPIAIRNRAILVVGWCSALRAASIVDLDVGDVSFTKEGAVLRIRREKNDQLGKGRWIGLPLGKRRDTCPVRALRDWLKVRRQLGDEGPLFTHVRFGRPRLKRLGTDWICLIVQAALRAIGKPHQGYGSHSLRAGLITAAAEADVQPLKIAAHSGHKTLAMVQRYFRRSDVFRSNLLDRIRM